MKKIILFINTALLVLILLYIGTTYKKEKKAYVNIGDLYDGFDMKKELEGKLITIQNQRKSILDSLELELQMFAKKISQNHEIPNNDRLEFDMLKRNFMSRKEQFSEENNRVSLEFKNQIFSQLNKYVEEYAKENEYDYLFGTSGQGSIMYAKPKNNITHEISNYINERYKGNS